MSIESLLGEWSNLNVESEPTSFKASLLTFCRWRAKPISVHLSASMTVKQVKDFLKHDVRIGRNVSDLPKLRTMKSDLEVKPYEDHVPPEAKPTVLFMICSIFHDLFQKNPKLTSEELIETLSDFDLIMARNPLKNILCCDRYDNWVLNAYRPIKDGPLLIERSESYETNPGSIGMQFKHAMVNKSLYHRVYAIHDVKLNELHIALSGALDCVDDDGEIVALKTKPSWANPLRNDRDVDSLLQAKLGGTTSMVIGQFSAPRGQKQGPVMFKQSNIQKFNIDDYPNKLVSQKAELRLRSCHKLLQAIVKKCPKNSVIYQVSGRGYNCARIIVEENVVDETQLPISQTVINCAKAIAGETTPIMIE